MASKYDVIAGLKEYVSGDDVLFKRLVQTLASTIDLNIQKLGAAYESVDLEGLKSIVHTLKPTFVLISDQEASQIIGLIQENLLDGVMPDSHLVMRLVAKLRELGQATIDEMEKW